MQIKIELIVNDKKRKVKVDDYMSIKEILQEMKLYKESSDIDIYVKTKKEHMDQNNKLKDVNIVNNEVIIITM